MSDSSDYFLRVLSVSSGCSNGIPQTRGFGHSNLVPTILEARKPYDQGAG